MKVLVTGAAGFIGSMTSASLIKSGHNVTAIDNFNDYYDPSLKEARIKKFLKGYKFKLYRGDIRDEKLTEKIFKNEKTFEFIKIDCQGSEIDIIKGGLEMCKRAEIFLLEASVYPYNSGAPMFDELKNFMASIGFNYIKTVSDITHPDNHGVLIQHDVLFSKRELV